MTKKTILSLIQPTGELHLGNYFGAIKNWVELQNSNKYNCTYGIANYHAMTMPYKISEFNKNVNSILIDLLACGIELEKSTLFVQSLVPEHTELYWILNTVTSFGELSRMTQFKDKSIKVKEQGINVGLFSYPILQAADIMIYKADFVPVGEDQLQHLELTRDIAKRFNKRFGNYFPVPKAKLTNVPRVMSFADPNKKMSKSLGNKHYIGVFEEEKSIRKKIRSAVTDTGEKTDKISPGVRNLFEILLAMNKHEEHAVFLKNYKDGNIRYKDLKDIVADSLIELTTPLIEKRKEILANKKKYIQKIYEASEKNRKIAQETLKEVRKIVGLPNIK